MDAKHLLIFYCCHRQWGEDGHVNAGG